MKVLYLQGRRCVALRYVAALEVCIYPHDMHIRAAYVRLWRGSAIISKQNNALHGCRVCILSRNSGGSGT